MTLATPVGNALARGTYDLILRSLALVSPKDIVHLHLVLSHATTQDDRSKADRTSLAAHLNGSAVASIAAGPIGATHHVTWRVPDPPPLVSIIVPTRDRLGLLRQMADSILRLTAYANYEILIVDNDSQEPDTLSWFADVTRATERVRVIPHPGPFNYSALNNSAVKQARGEVLVFLNNDIEVIDGAWLSELVSLAMRPDTGCVGAKLLYPSGRIQHGGIIFGLQGNAGHAHRFFHCDSHGYFGRLALRHDVMAVTGACLAVRRSLFEDVGGMNETDLPVDFNDIDLCLKIHSAGYRNVWTPFAELIHHESASRGKATQGKQRPGFAEERAYMVRTWGLGKARDPFHNPNLSDMDEDYRIALPPGA